MTVADYALSGDPEGWTVDQLADIVRHGFCDELGNVVEHGFGDALSEVDCQYIAWEALTELVGL